MANMNSAVTSLLMASLLCVPVHAQVTQRVSLGVNANPANDLSTTGSLSVDARYVAFWSYATNLVPGDTNGTWDVFIRDRQDGATERVSVDSSGVEGNGESWPGWVSADARYVSFISAATNLVPSDTNGEWDVFVRDRQVSTTERVSISSTGEQGNNWSGGGAITPDGRYIVFFSTATNLVPASPPAQVYVRDRQNGTTELASLGQGGIPPNNESWGGTISDDGRHVAFVSIASNLVPGDTNGDYDVFVRDRFSPTTERVSVASDGSEANGTLGFNISARLSSDGRFVAFEHGATNLVAGDTNGRSDVFVRDRLNGITERVSIDSGGTQANGNSERPWISADGRYVAFVSGATNLVPGDTNGVWDVFVRDRVGGTTERLSVSSNGVQANASSSSWRLDASVDGRYVLFDSYATNLVPSDTNGMPDVFVRDRFGIPSFTSLCHPGVGGVISCPCANAPGGSGRGCDNSSNTGGAILGASGGTYLSSDSLVFTTSGEKPTALSIVSQWSGFNPTGVVFGQGVRCTSGTLKRLYTKTASGGSITAPNFGAGDPQVSIRSAELGDTILAGQSRWYLVYYRDPIVLGGCPPSSTFNCTQTGQVTWAP